MSDFLRAEYRTYKSVFPQVYILPVGHPHDATRIQNITLIALKRNDLPIWTSDDPEINEYLSHRWTKPINEDLPILTDDYTPVDHYVGKFLKVLGN